MSRPRALLPSERDGSSVRWLADGYVQTASTLLPSGSIRNAAIIGRAVIGARAGAAIVAAAGLQALGVEFLDRGVIGRAERDMGAGAAQVPCADTATARARPWARSRRRYRRASTAHSRAAPAPPCRSARWRRDCRRCNPMWSYMMISSEARDAARSGDHPSQWRASRSWKILRSPREAWRNFSGETPAARWKVRTKLERSPKPTS